MFWAQRNALDVELSQFGAALPDFASTVYQDQLCPSDVELVSIKTLMHAATIHVHREYLAMYHQSYDRCVRAANAITGMITAELNEGDYSFLNPIISVSLSDNSVCSDSLLTAPLIDLLEGCRPSLPSSA